MADSIGLSTLPAALGDYDRRGPEDGGMVTMLKIGVECPECESKALYIGTSTMTLLYCPPFTDEEGRYHSHDTNTTTTGYTCRKCGHSFTEASRGSCWCGWPEKEGREETDKARD